MMECIQAGIYRGEGKYYTLNLVPGEDVYEEELVEQEGFEYRRWDPNRSKLCAFLEKEHSLPVKPDIDVLYLGAGDGTTVSHLSDIVTDGKIFAVEIARNPFRNLLSLSKKRKNIYPIMADARDPSNYDDIVSRVDLIYQDISQRDQKEIFLKNLRFLQKGSFGMIAVKARSINVSESPEVIYEGVEKRLKDEGYEVKTKTDISRWQKDHSIITIKK
ncbi:MAG: fibrillarin-like rRNA/tRNA 2'-O-methyltransferase [Thermoplasmata archaeon]